MTDIPNTTSAEIEDSVADTGPVDQGPVKPPVDHPGQSDEATLFLLAPVEEADCGPAPDDIHETVKKSAPADSDPTNEEERAAAATVDHAASLIVLQVEVAALTSAVEAVRFGAGDVRQASPAGPHAAGTVTPPRFCLIISRGTLRLHTAKNSIIANSMIALAAPAVVPKDEYAIEVLSPALLTFFDRRHSAENERQPKGGSSLTSGLCRMTFNPDREELTINFPKSQYCTSAIACPAPAAIPRLNDVSPAYEQEAASVLARALSAVTDTPPKESNSLRQAFGKLNVISCEDGIMRGGSTLGITNFTHPTLTPFKLNVWRRDAPVLATLLRRLRKFRLRTEPSSLVFDDGVRVIKVDTAPYGFAETKPLIAAFEPLSAGWRFSSFDLLNSTLFQSLVQRQDSDRNPITATLMVEPDGEYFQLVLRSTGANGSEARTAIEVRPSGGVALDSNGPAIIRVAALLRALRADDIDVSAILNFASGHILLQTASNKGHEENGGGSFSHILAGQLGSPVLSCRSENRE